ncbi:unnamed protein product [Clonostachys rosea]|uniref:Protein kinase domain-containing protein n=1 Tax=Bionectria ochroleuca TaxID=29856 RepID=A0ABY6TRN8_BIOOC|nr:unnamed protein product [Clonostachys rosea]
MTQADLPSRETVESLCEERGFKSNGFAFNDRIWVKYGTGATLAEAALQRYLCTKVDHNIVRIPEVFDAWKSEEKDYFSKVYILMENIQGEDYMTYSNNHTENVDSVFEAVVAAVRHIWEIPLPEKAKIGPLERQIPHDRFFGDYGAHRTFENLEELETWINNQLKEAEYKERVALQGEPLVICHGDIHPWNILVNGEGRVTFIDWGYSGIYTREFEELALIHQWNRDGAKLAKALHKALFGPKPTKQMRAFTLVANYNQWGR